MGCLKVAVCLLIVAVAAPVSAQTQSYSSSSNAIVIASASISDVREAPLYVRVVSGRIVEENYPLDARIATTNGIYYQQSGTVELNIDGDLKKLHEMQGAFIPRGASVIIRRIGNEPARYVQFLLSPVGDFDLSFLPAIHERELYRPTFPLPDLREGNYVVDLKRVTLARQAPPDLPHHRSGAALHFVLSGSGAETINGIAVSKGPWSLSYEPSSTVYQWSNPGNVPLIYLVLNINPASKSAVLADTSSVNLLP